MAVHNYSTGRVVQTNTVYRTHQEEFHQLAREYNRELILDRGMDIEARVLEIIKVLSS